MPDDDVAGRPIAIAAAALLIMVAVVVAAVFALAAVWRLPSAGMRLDAAADPVAGPRLQSAPQDDRRRDRERARAISTSSGWVDPARGIVRIPVGDAMALLAARGRQGDAPAPARAPAPASSAARPAQVGR